MFLTTVRIKRAQARALTSVLTATQIAALPRDEQRRCEALSIHVGGNVLAVVHPGRAAQDPTVIWKHEQWAIPDTDLLALVKQSVTAMDGAAAGRLVTTAGDVEEAEQLAAPVTRRRRRRATVEAEAA